jgi:7-cyano-7-deazaguanine synthase
VLETPLMWIDKAQTFAMARDLGGETFLKIVCEETHSCYAGNREIVHEWGRGCGVCPACQLRAEGWKRFVAQGA